MNTLLVRTLSALILAPIVLYAVYAGGLIFQIMMILSLALGLKEWLNMCRIRENGQVSWGWLLAGGLYISISIYGLYWLRLSNDSGHLILFWLLALVWAADTGAYLSGSTIGGPKLAPKISPKKTWAGFLGALVSAALIGLAYGYFMNDGALNLTLVVLSTIIGGLSQMGDLLESYAKRHFGVKDSGKIIPGHGGILDRIDGLMAAAIGAGVIIYLDLELGFSWN